MSSPRLVLATHNLHKVEELRQILMPEIAGLLAQDVVSAAQLAVPEPAEDGLTFEQNALIKARALAAATGLPALADDSGLVVDVLGGAPGIFSARWAGSHGDDLANLNLLLSQLADIGDPHRTARFECAAALVLPDGSYTVRTGVLEGRLITQPRGGNGFGYDPILVPTGLDVTCAELTSTQKNALSHRGKALRALVPAVVEALQRSAS